MADEQTPAPEPKITAADVRRAEKLVGLSYTDHERKQLLGNVNDRLKLYDTLRAVKLDNMSRPP